MSVPDPTALEKRIHALVAAGAWAQVLPLAEEHTARTRERYGEGSVECARSLFSLARTHERLNQLDEATASYREAVEILQAAGPEAHRYLTRTARELAGLEVRLGRLDAAEAVRTDLLDRHRRLRPQDRRPIAEELNGLGLLNYQLGRYAQATARLKEAITLWRELPDAKTELAVSLDNLGLVKHDTGAYSEAEKLHLEAAEQFRRQGRELDYATALHNAGSLYLTMGRPEAEGFLDRALAIRQALLPSASYGVATTLADLGRLRLEQGRLDDADDLLREAVDAFEKSGLPREHPDVMKALGNLQMVAVASGRFADSLPLQLDALAQARRTLPPDHPELIGTLLAAAGSLKALHRYDEAEPLVIEAVDLARRVLGESHITTATALDALVSLYLETGRGSDAIAPLVEAAQIDDRVLEQIAGIGVERLRVMYARTIHAHTSALLATVQVDFPHEPAAVRAAFDSVLRRKGLLAEIANARRERALAERFPELRDALAELSAIRREMAEQALRGPTRLGMEAADELKMRLSELADRRDALEDKITHALPEDSLALELGRVDSGAVAEALPEDAALVEFVRYDAVGQNAERQLSSRPARYAAFVVLAGRPDEVRMIDLGDAARVAQLVLDFRAAIVPGEALRDVVRAKRGSEPLGERIAGEALRAALLDPLDAALRGRTRLIVAPDGELYSVPFEVLPARGSGRLIDSYRLSYIDTGRDVLRFHRPAERSKGVPAVVAAPDYDLGRLPTSEAPADAMRFEPLPGTRREGKLVAERFGTRPLMGAEALERTVRELEAPSILHFATHGFFIANPMWDIDSGIGMSLRLITVGPAATPLRPDPRRWENLDDPLVRCGLALAGANVALRGGEAPPEAEDGLLNGQDILAMDLLGTELVVASACDSGLGDLSAGEGIFGLRRAFTHAGARTLVMSLWKVPDRATQRLMEAFYARLAKGKGCAEALRCAQLELAAERPPSDWGAFICHGDPRPLSFELRG
jgi:CHAT domain-containing protein/tetratricopeptide (TPR) repeat protein